MGLVTWEGRFWNGQISMLTGGLDWWVFNLSSICESWHTEKISVRVIAGGDGFELGGRPGRWPSLGEFGGQIQLDDGLAQPAPESLEGNFSVAGVSIAWGLGFTWSHLMLGQAETLGAQVIAGVGQSIGSARGQAIVESFRVDPCDC